METSSLNTENSTQGSSQAPSSLANDEMDGDVEEMEAKTSSDSSVVPGADGTTTGGQDMSDAGSVDELPVDGGKGEYKKSIFDPLGRPQSRPGSDRYFHTGCRMSIRN